jgi:hypothetical protein
MHPPSQKPASPRRISHQTPDPRGMLRVLAQPHTWLSGGRAAKGKGRSSLEAGRLQGFCALFPICFFGSHPLPGRRLLGPKAGGWGGVFHLGTTDACCVGVRVCVYIYIRVRECRAGPRTRTYIHPSVLGATKQTIDDRNRRV